MQGRDGSDNNSGSLGICQRLFNFFMNSLIARGLKRVTMGSTSDHSVPNGSNEIFLEDGSSRNVDQEKPIKPTEQNGDQVKSNIHTSSEIFVEFRHTDGAIEKWSTNTSVDNPRRDQLTLMQKGTAVEKRKNKEKETAQGVTTLPQIQQETDSQDLDNTNGGGGKWAKKTVTITQGVEKREKNKLLTDKNVSTTEKLTLAIEHDKYTKSKPPRRVRPLLSVASNINEKSDAFIRSRKEAMTRNLQPEPH